LVEDNFNAIPRLDAFAKFRAGGKERRVVQPQQLEAIIIGNYGTFIGA